MTDIVLVSISRDHWKRKRVPDVGNVLCLILCWWQCLVFTGRGTCSLFW